MNRRLFLALLAAPLGAPMELDLDRLLWLPGARTIIIPERPRVQRLDAPYVDRELGIAIRLIKRWDLRSDYRATNEYILTLNSEEIPALSEGGPARA